MATATTTFVLHSILQLQVSMETVTTTKPKERGEEIVTVDKPMLKQAGEQSRKALLTLLLVTCG